jgi:hypothetical protein
MTAAVPMIIARDVRKDLIALVLIEVVAEIKDSLNSIIRN